MNEEEERARAKPTKAERAACLEELAEDEDEELCSARAIREARLADLPSEGGTIAKYMLVGLGIDALLSIVAILAVSASVPSH